MFGPRVQRALAGPRNPSPHPNCNRLPHRDACCEHVTCTSSPPPPDPNARNGRDSGWPCLPCLAFAAAPWALPKKRNSSWRSARREPSILRHTKTTLPSLDSPYISALVWLEIHLCSSRPDARARNLDQAYAPLIHIDNSFPAWLVSPKVQVSSAPRCGYGFCDITLRLLYMSKTQDQGTA